MNYLAHLYLAKGQSGLTIGGFLADFVKGPLSGKYPADIELGMRLHRKIDTWSDQHAAIKQLREILPVEFGRYTGIIADVLGDHFLSKHWSEHTDESIKSFSQEQLIILQQQKQLYPERAQWVLERMSQGQWLTNYHNMSYCLGALGNIGKRLSRENPLHLLEQPVTQNYEQLRELCVDILNDLKLNVAEWRAEYAEQLTQTQR